jgi:hypothetical protein
LEREGGEVEVKERKGKESGYEGESGSGGEEDKKQKRRYKLSTTGLCREIGYGVCE